MMWLVKFQQKNIPDDSVRKKEHLATKKKQVQKIAILYFSEIYI